MKGFPKYKVQAMVSVISLIAIGDPDWRFEPKATPLSNHVSRCHALPSQLHKSSVPMSSILTQTKMGAQLNTSLQEYT